MVNENINKFTPQSVKKPTATVSYFNEAEWNKDLTKESLEQQELINNSYQSEIDNQEKGYGPCFDYSCRCTKNQLRDQISQLERKIPNAPSSAYFRLSVGFSQNRLWNWHFNNGDDWIYMYSVSDARETLRKFENGSILVSGATGADNTPNARIKTREVMDCIRDSISRNDRDESVDKTKDFNY